MTTIDILSLISCCAFISSFGCYTAYFIISIRQICKQDKAEKEKDRDYKALQNLRGDEYWKAYTEYKKKYPN